MDSGSTKELRSLLRQARKDGRKPFAGYIKEEDGSIHVLLLADASEFVYRRLKQYEPILLAVFQSKWPDNIKLKSPLCHASITKMRMMQLDWAACSGFFAAKRSRTNQ